MNKERLLALANFLDTVPKAKFNLASWRENPDEDDEDEREDSGVSDAELLDHACSTTGCAVGWACTMPEFQAQGLSWGTMHSPIYVKGDHYETNWEAVEDFFELTEKEARTLFDTECYLDKPAGPENVAAKIRELVTIGLPL